MFSKRFTFFIVIVAIAFAANAVIAQGSPQISNITLTAATVANSPIGDDTRTNGYIAGDTLTFTVTYDQTVRHSNAPASPAPSIRLRFTIGDEQKTADYGGGNFTSQTTIAFTYTVQTGDAGTVAIAAEDLELLGGARLDETTPGVENPNANLAHGAYRFNISVNAKNPTVTAVAFVASTSHTYTIGEDIEVIVTYTEPVDVTSDPNPSPTLTLKLGDTQTRTLAHTATDAEKKVLTFAYTVQWNDPDDATAQAAVVLPKIPNDASIYSGNYITDLAGNPAEAPAAPGFGPLTDGTINTNNAPAFANNASIDDIDTPVNTAIGTINLPKATDADSDSGDSLTYTLTPNLPIGLTFDAIADPPTLTGTPTVRQAQTQYTYTVTDKKDATAALPFSIAINGPPTFRHQTIADITAR